MVGRSCGKNLCNTSLCSAGISDRLCKQKVCGLYLNFFFLNRSSISIKMGTRALKSAEHSLNNRFIFYVWCYETIDKCKYSVRSYFCSIPPQPFTQHKVAGRSKHWPTSLLIHMLLTCNFHIMLTSNAYPSSIWGRWLWWEFLRAASPNTFSYGTRINDTTQWWLICLLRDTTFLG